MHQTGRSSEAEVEYRSALAIYQKLAEENPASTEIRRRLGFIFNNLGSLLLNVAGRPAAAEAEFRKAMTIKQKIADDNPAVTEFRNDVALSHRNLGETLSQEGRPSESEAEYRTAVAIYQKLAQDNPAVSEFRSSLADSLSSRAPAAPDGPVDGIGGRVLQGAGDTAKAGRRQPGGHRVPARPGSQPPQSGLPTGGVGQAVGGGKGVSHGDRDLSETG